jgi:hypothetical protein
MQSGVPREHTFAVEATGALCKRTGWCIRVERAYFGGMLDYVRSDGRCYMLACCIVAKRAVSALVTYLDAVWCDWHGRCYQSLESWCIVYGSGVRRSMWTHQHRAAVVAAMWHGWQWGMCSKSLFILCEVSGHWYRTGNEIHAVRHSQWL